MLSVSSKGLIVMNWSYLRGLYLPVGLLVRVPLITAEDFPVLLNILSRSFSCFLLVGIYCISKALIGQAAFVVAGILVFLSRPL